MRTSPLAILIVSAPLAAALLGFWLTREPADLRPSDIPATGPVRVALAGDVLLTAPLGPILRHADFIALRDRIRHAHFAAASLEMNLLGADLALQADARPEPRWPYGSALEAEALKYLGFDAVALGNDHAADYGPEAAASTIRILDAAGLLHAGTGFDLGRARAAVFATGGQSAYAGSDRGGAGAARRRLAFISVAISSQPDARATPGRPDIAGRVGVNPLRYTAEITVDPSTFQTLKDSIGPLEAGPPAADGELTMFGATIRKGDRTSVEFTADEEDQRAILAEIRAARSAAEAVIVSLHSHEPFNGSEEPAPFVERFARAAVDAGATLVAGHGPHRLRRVELRNGGAIFYSLGNFLYQTTELDFRAANMYDRGANLLEAAAGALAGDAPPDRREPPDDPAWWEGVVAEAVLDEGRVVELRLLPVDLEVDNSFKERGMPRLARGNRADAILRRLIALSGAEGGGMQIQNGVAVVQVSPPTSDRR